MQQNVKDACISGNKNLPLCPFLREGVYFVDF